MCIRMQLSLVQSADSGSTTDNQQEFFVNTVSFFFQDRNVSSQKQLRDGWDQTKGDLRKRNGEECALHS